MNKIKWIIIGAFAILIAIIGGMIAYNSSLNDKYELAVENNKAFIAEINQDECDLIVYMSTIEQLEYIGDSISQELLNVKNELNIKDKQVKQLSRMASEFKKTDTVVFKDTIFKDTVICIDTTVGDKWMNTRLKLEYPNTVVIEPHVISTKDVVMYASKETVNPPKKCKIARLFQKKHTVIRATIKEQNPYITSQQTTFIQIQK